MVQGNLSRSLNLDFGVPQGSCLGPLLFTIYASTLFDVIKVHLSTVHCYADDTQLYVSFSPNISTGQFEAVTAIQHCVDDIRNWMTNDKLLLNDDKTEFLMIGTKKQLAKVNIDYILIGDCTIRPKGVVKNLGTWLDSTLSMNSPVNNTCSNAFYYLYNIRRIRKYLSRRSTETLIHAFVSSRVDYCNSLLYGLPAYQLNKLQRVQSAAARLIFLESKYCHVRPLLYNLHWLPVKFRIDFKILLLTYKAINGLAPFYLQELITLKEACRYKLHSDCDGLLQNPVKFKTLTTLGDRSFAAAAPQLWNSLPYLIRSSRSVASFKKTLKTFLFQKAFLGFYVLFNLAFSRFYAVFYDLSSLGNFYSFSVDIIVLLFFVGSCTFWHVYFMHLLLFLFYPSIFIFILNIFIFKR